MEYYDISKIEEMESFIKAKTELDFNVSSKGSRYFTIIKGVLKDIVYDNVNRVDDIMADEFPEMHEMFKDKEELTIFVLEELPRSSFNLRKHFKTELKNINCALGYLAFVQEKMANPNLDKQNEGYLVLKSVFGDEAENERLANNF